jgi:ABC-2 type transport system permease protein
MRHFFTILAHELRMLFVSPSTYIAAVLFLEIMGFIFTFLVLKEYSSKPQDASPATVFFNLFWVPVLFMVPLLTMKSISEERRMGTLETLLTTPVSTVEVILGKFAAAYLLYILLWGLTGGFFLILNKFARDARLLDPGPLYGGYLFVAVSGLFFIAIGIFASSLSRNQAVAGILSFAILFGLFIGMHFVPDYELLNHGFLLPLKEIVDYAHVFQHLDDFTKGIVDTRQLLFYISGAVLALIFSILGVEAKLLHS